MRDMIMRPELVGQACGGYPLINFEVRDVRGKSRLIGIPNRPMRSLHRQLGKFLRGIIMHTDGSGYGLRKLPSAYGCVEGSNPLRNASQHKENQYFYITDISNAYGTVSLERLALLLTYLIQYEAYEESGFSLAWFGQDERVWVLRQDEAYQPVLGLLVAHFGGLHGQGLAIGGPLSPYLMNLYCEVYIDAPLRKFCEPREITYTRYVDDLTFSAKHFIGEETRRRIRAVISRGGFTLNRQKSRAQMLSMGQVSITQIGLARDTPDGSTRLVFSQKKRRKLHGIIHSYLTRGMDWPEKVRGYAAEFLYYYKNVAVRTATDEKTFELCKRFEREWKLYGGPKHRTRSK
ncbi:MAG: hypothetical protein KBD27_01870 [Candidatus Moranbacteria bacterium]|nr:hypothetical protein [Candidatus Moranbacteria bacterium]